VGSRRPILYSYRATFGLGFIVLGALTLWRVATVPVPAGNKIVGVVIAVAMIALGAFRIVQYVRYRRRIGG
jgi:hypothetical protein